MGIFGFCIIHDFSVTNDVLQSDIMVYVNTLAEIVHSWVDEFGGAANKNIGEAFLLVWKFDPLDYEYKENDEINLIKSY